MSYTPPKDRIISIDVLRGIAVLGILIMNIQNFSMIGAAYMNPSAYGDITGINKWVWILSHILADFKFISIFSILFGAGILLFMERAKKRSGHYTGLHYWRNTLLLFFGLIHAYFIWAGDILVAYSLCGFFVFIFRNKSVTTLLILSGVFFIIPILLYSFSGWSVPFWPEESYQDTLKGWAPAQDMITKEINSVTGSWMEQLKHRATIAFSMQTFIFFYMVFWRVTSMMLLGMALYKSNVLSALRSKAFYTKLIVIGLCIGYLLIILGINFNFKQDWDMQQSMFFGVLFNYTGSAAVALAYIAIVMLISRSSSFKGFNTTMAKVGKMAFSNYILTSVICYFIFSGTGFSLFGKIERWEQILFTIGIWLVLIIFTNLWLRKYQLGPLEWFWRRLTYLRGFKKQ